MPNRLTPFNSVIILNFDLNLTLFDFYFSKYGISIIKFDFNIFQLDPLIIKNDLYNRKFDLF